MQERGSNIDHARASISELVAALVVGLTDMAHTRDHVKHPPCGHPVKE
jgi:hypothetical protein